MALQNIGRYQITGELGKGAMGVVYKATDPNIGRVVAVKTTRIDANGIESEELIRRFKNEARAAGTLNHPNIVTIYDAGEQEGLFYIAMEYIEGQTLQRILHEKRVLAVEKIVEIAKQICAGLDYAHSRGVVHRDIKPANVMLTNSGLVKITDFGIARSGGGMTSTGQVLGSPNYMSPEQVKGRTVDGRSDIFSLGVVLYEAFTGEKPFDGQNITTIIYKIVNEAPIPPLHLDATLHPGLSTVITRALAKSPDARYQTCSELAYDLENYKALAMDAGATMMGTLSMPPVAEMMIGTATALSRPPVSIPEIPAEATLASAPTVVQSPVASTAASAAVAQATPAPAPAQTAQTPPKQPVATPAKGPQPSPGGKKSSNGLVIAVAALVVVIAGGGLLRWRHHKKVAEEAAQQATQQATQQVAPPPIPPMPAPDQNATATPPTDNTAQPQTPPETPATETPTNAAAEQSAAVAAKPKKPEKKMAYGDLRVTSDPPGASVTIDGKHEPAWITPFTAPKLSSGPHAITWTKAGFMNKQSNADVIANKQSSVEARLMSSASLIAVNSAPAGAAIFIDDKPAGKNTPATINVPKGEHKVNLRKEGYKEAATSLKIDEGQTASFAPTLEPMPAETTTAAAQLGKKDSNPFAKIGRFFGGKGDQGTLQVKTNPPGASVSLDGNAAPNKTPFKRNVKPGTYKLVVSLEGYKPVTRDVQIEKGKTVGLDETLEKQ